MSATANIVLLVVGAAAFVFWMVSLARWDGKCHCDKSRCEYCVYHTMCEEENKP